MWMLFVGLTNFLILVSAQEILVNLPNGTVRGTQGATGWLGDPYYAFKKIPYAKPPIGNLRFEPPQPADAWDGIRDGTVFDIACYQMLADNTRNSEDCLYLNIYTTQLPNNITSLKPVWIFIHGGSFSIGSATIDPRHVMEYDIVFVSINYRLGPFGFLSTGDEVIPGNNGLKDQRLAIRYVKENIKLFGGDPDKITVGGQSAGASCVSFHLLNPNNEGLFRAVIQESGSYLNPWSLQRVPGWVASQTAGAIDPKYANVNSTTELASFLKKVTANQIDTAAAKLWAQYGEFIYEGVMYSPVIEVSHEDAFLTEKMYQKLRAGDFLQVTALIGFNSEEEIEQAADMATVRANAASLDRDPSILVSIDMNVGDNIAAQSAVAASVKQLYTNSNFGGNLGAYIKYQSDYWFIRSILRQVQLQAKYSSVYLYEFSYHGEIGFQYPKIEGADRVAHSEELNYMFGTNNANTYNAADRAVYFRMVEMFTNFVKDLNPTSRQTENVDVDWPQVPSSGNEILFLNINDTSQVQSDPRESYPGWVNIYDSLNIEDILDTY